MMKSKTVDVEDMSNHNKKSLDDELDDLSIRILELMNENIKCKMDIERAVRSGCMDLAKTRYILGSTHRVSAMSIPSEELIATTRIVSLKEEGKLLFDLKQETAKKRIPEKESDNEQNSYGDPLKWFGILVPMNLRHGQAWFLKALDHSVQSANISVDIETSMQKYEKLLNSKNDTIKN